MVLFQPLDAALYVELYIIVAFVLLMKSRLRLSSPAFIFMAFYTLQMGLGPIFEIVSGRGLPSLVSPFIDVLWPLAVYVLGYCIADVFHLPKRKKSKSSPPIYIGTDTLWWAYAICILAGLVYVLKIGLNPFSDSFNDDRIASQSGMGIFTYLNGALIVILPLLFERVLDNQLGKKKFFGALFVALMIFVLRGSRGLCMTPLFLMGMLIDIRKPIKWKTIVRFGLVCLVVVSVMGSMRSGNGSTFIDSIINTTCNHVENLNRVYGAFKYSDNYQYGSTFFFNYNIILPGEGLDYTMWLKDLVGATFSGGGMTPSIVGDFYINFGYVGVYIGMFLLGFISFRLEVAARNGSINRVFFVYLCWECATVVGGGISNGMLVLTTNTLMYLGLKFISSRNGQAMTNDGAAIQHTPYSGCESGIYKNRTTLFEL